MWFIKPLDSVWDLEWNAISWKLLWISWALLTILLEGGLGGGSEVSLRRDGAQALLDLERSAARLGDVAAVDEQELHGTRKKDKILHYVHMI